MKHEEKIIPLGGAAIIALFGVVSLIPKPAPAFAERDISTVVDSVSCADAENTGAVSSNLHVVGHRSDGKKIDISVPLSANYNACAQARKLEAGKDITFHSNGFADPDGDHFMQPRDGQLIAERAPGR